MSSSKSTVYKLAPEFNKTLEDFKNALSHIIFVLDEGENAFPERELQFTEAKLTAFLEATKEVIYGFHGLHDLISAKRPFIKWVPELQDSMVMSWQGGIAPWSFWLKYPDLTPQVKELIKLIKDKWAKGELEKHPSPELGNHVIICSKKRTYRGIITALVPKFLVTNADDGKEREEDIDSCYQLTHSFCEVQASVIHCTVSRTGEENFDSWKTEYSNAEQFVSLLQNSRLTVKIVDKIMKVIPTYVIDLCAYNEEEESSVNIRDWVLEVCQNSSSEEKKLSIANDLIPPVNIINKPVKSSIIPSFDNLIPDRSSNECKEVKTNRLLKVAESMNSSKLNNQIDTMLASKVPFKFESVIDAPEFSPINGLKREPNHTALNGNPACETLRKKVESDCKPKASFKFESVLDAPEFSPVNGFIKTGSFTKMNGLHEIPVIPGNYQPKDDKRECSFYAAKGHCWKLGCTKEHKKTIPGKWTNDEEEIYSDTFTSITLPEIGHELKVKVTHVSSPNSFYIHLPDVYSVPDGQTLDDLIKDLNGAENHKEMMLLSTPPSLGEFLIAFSAKKNKWLRGNVCDVEDDVVQVFFVDYGITEDVELTKCRKMLGQFNHLPSQAVYCNLAKAFTDLSTSDDEKLKSGKEFLEHHILDKVIDVQIIDSVASESRLEVIATVNKVNVNDLVVKEGYCKNHID